MDLVVLEQSPVKTSFVYNDIKHSTFIAKDGTLLINNFSDAPIKYSSFMYKVRATLGIEQPQEKAPVIEKAPVPPVKRVEELGKYLSDPTELSEEFLKTLQLSSIFLTDYKNHPNIKQIDFKTLNSDHEENKLDKTIPVLYFQDGSKINVRYKWNGSYSNKGWYTLKGYKPVGAFLPHTDIKIKKASILLLVEGLKDGINDNIGFPKCDILVSDSINSIFDFSLVHNLSQYTKIIFFHDLGVSEKQKLFMLQGNKNSESKGIKEILKDEADLKKFYSKMNYIDYSKIPEGVTDSTDFLESLKYTTAKTKSKSLSELRKVFHKERFIKIYNRDLAEQIDIRLERAIKNNNQSLFMQLTTKKIELKVCVQKEFNYYVSNLMKTPKNATILNLDTSKYLSVKTEKIFHLFNKYSHVLLGSPTGTGKSELVLGHVKNEFVDEHNNTFSTLAVKSILEEQNKPFVPQNIISEGLPLFFKNIIVITPLQDITVGMGQHPLYTYIQNGKLNDLEADLNAPYIAITTDTFENLKANPKTKAMMENRINQAELISFDEQHYIAQARGFRGLVVKAYESLKEYKGNVLYMSGTPIYSEAEHAHPVTAILSRNFISKIKYYRDPFKDEKAVLDSMRSHLKKGSILFYCKATKEADYVHNLLMKEGKTVVKITSTVGRDKYLKNGVEIDKNELAGIKENIVYVATTKITTGVNLKNLIAIYQHGTAYDPNTFIQLTARLRGNGDYYLIKVKKETNQNSYNQNKAIHLSLLAKRFNVTSLSTAWQNKEFRDYLKKKTELPYKKSSVKDFLKTYSKAFQLIQAEGLGKLSEKKNNQDDDFEFVLKQHEDPTREPVTKVSYLDGSQIKKTFVSADATTYIKYFERKLIDWLNRYGDIEEMNKIYNLSFDYINMNNNDWEEIKPKLFITEEDQNLKDEKKEEKKELLEEFQIEVTKKFQGLVTFKQLKENKLTDTNINKLLEDKRLDLKKYRDAIKAKRTIEAKIIALQFHLIPQAVIVEAVMALLRSGKLYVTLKELSTQLEQYEFLTNKRAEAPFKKFLKDFFENDEFFKDELIFKSTHKDNGLQVRDVVTLPKETLKRLKAIKDTEEKEKALKIKVEKIKSLTEKYESYLELLDSPERHEFYDMKKIKKDSIDIKEEINKTKGKIYETQ
jgi:hypothetical protein